MKIGSPDAPLQLTGRGAGAVRALRRGMRRVGLVVVATVLLCSQWHPPVCAAAARPDAQIVFRLCSANIEHVALAEVAGGVTVHVQLKEAAARRLAALTRRGGGKLLAVLVGEELFSRATVQGPLTSGRLVSSPRSRLAAARLLESLKASGPAVGCVPVQ